MRRILCVCLFAIFVFVTSAQQPQQTQTQAQPNPPVPQAPAVQAPGAIKVSTEVVIEEVNVKDKSGKPIEGLTAKDFVLTEDGVPQTISFVEYQELPPVGAPPAPPSTNPIVTTAAPATRIQIAPEPPGDTRYHNHRLVALYFDMSTMKPADQLRAYYAALKFIDTQMDPSIYMAVMTFEGSAVRVRQDLTGDRAQIKA